MYVADPYERSIGKRRCCQLLGEHAPSQPGARLRSVALGAQNAFVLRQGIQREHVLPVVALCTGTCAHAGWTT